MEGLALVVALAVFGTIFFGFLAFLLVIGGFVVSFWWKPRKEVSREAKFSTPHFVQQVLPQMMPNQAVNTAETTHVLISKIARIQDAVCTLESKFGEFQNQSKCDAKIDPPSEKQILAAITPVLNDTIIVDKVVPASNEQSKDTSTDEKTKDKTVDIDVDVVGGKTVPVFNHPSECRPWNRCSKCLTEKQYNIEAKVKKIQKRSYQRRNQK
jgi:hypothetical protein